MLRALAVLLAAVFALAGCGDDSSSNPEEPEAGERVISDTIPASDLARVKDAEEAIAIECKLLPAAEDTGQKDVPLGKAIKDLIEVYAHYPEGRYTTGSQERVRNMERVLRDNASILKKCGKKALAERLEFATR